MIKNDPILNISNILDQIQKSDFQYPSYISFLGQPGAKAPQELFDLFDKYNRIHHDGRSHPYEICSDFCENIVAQWCTKRYNYQIFGHNILFTNGAVEGLNFLFLYFAFFKNKNILTTSPHYPYYLFCPNLRVIPTNNNKNRLEILLSNVAVNTQAFIINDPHNPFGDILSENDWLNFFSALRNLIDQNLVNQNVLIIVDRAYEEIVFHKQDLKVLIKLFQFSQKFNLSKNLVMLKSGTKSMALSRYRFGFVLTQNVNLVSHLKCLQARSKGFEPYQNKWIYSHLLQNVKSNYYVQASKHYSKILNFIYSKLSKNKLTNHLIIKAPASGMYFIFNFSKLKGFTANLRWKLNKDINGNLTLTSPRFQNLLTIQTDIDVFCFLNQYKQGLCLCPMSFFGMNQNDCLLRMTATDFVLAQQICNMIFDLFQSLNKL